MENSKSAKLSSKLAFLELNMMHISCNFLCLTFEPSPGLSWTLCDPKLECLGLHYEKRPNSILKLKTVTANFPEINPAIISLLAKNLFGKENWLI